MDTKTMVRSEFNHTKGHISEAELKLLGHGEDGVITPGELLDARFALVQALSSFDRACLRAGINPKPPRADL